MEGLPPARYPVSKTGGLHGLGGSTPSPSALFWIARPRWRAARPRKEHAGTRARRHGRVGKAARCYRAGGERRSQVRVLLPPHDATSSNGRTTGCYPVNAGSTPAVAVGWGNPGTPTGPLLMQTAWIHRVWPPGRQSRPPAATARASNDRCVSRGSRPGLLADRGCRPLKPATRVRIPLGASRWGNQGFPHPLLSGASGDAAWLSPG